MLGTSIFCRKHRVNLSYFEGFDMADVVPYLLSPTIGVRRNEMGELPEGTSPRVQTLDDTLERSGIRAQVTPSIQSLEWAKYLAFVSWMAPAVLTRLETYKFLQEAQTAAMVAAIPYSMTRIASPSTI